MTSLYNRYIAGAWPDGAPKERPADAMQSYPTQEEPVFTDISDEAVPTTQAGHTAQKSNSALKGLFGGNIKLPEFDADTVLLLVLVYFLVADDTENISDTLLIIGVLLLLGF